METIETPEDLLSCATAGVGTGSVEASSQARGIRRGGDSLGTYMAKKSVRIINSRLAFSDIRPLSFFFINTLFSSGSLGYLSSSTLFSVLFAWDKYHAGSLLRPKNGVDEIGQLVEPEMEKVLKKEKKREYEY